MSIEVAGPFCRVSFEPVNLNSHQQIKDFLLSQGWQPTEYTEKGSPKLTEDSYDSIKGELGQLIAKRAVLKHRAGMIFNLKKNGTLSGWLNTVRDDGRIEAGALTNATNTGRMAHRGLVNVPKPKDKDLWPSNVQLRDLFIVPDNRLMMGIDADGLEARMEAHSCLPYPGGKEYAHELIDGDVHAKNAEFFNTDRDGAKGPKYCLVYGGQPYKLSVTVGIKPPSGCKGQGYCNRCPKSVKSKCQGAKWFNAFWDGNTALKGFKDRITEYWRTTGQKKFIKGIDGRKIWVRSEHSIVNAYFQSTGSITVKVAALFMDKWCREKSLDAQQIILYHDEYEYELDPAVKEEVGMLASKSFEQAGKYLGIRVPVTGTPAFGMNWHDVH